MAMPDATGDVRTLGERLRFLAENEKVSDRLLALLDDANVVATILAHGIKSLVTLNVSDFRRYDKHVQVVPL